MKKSFGPFMLLFAVISIFSACKKDVGSSPTAGTYLKLASNGNAISFNECEFGTVTVNSAVQTAIIGTDITNGKVGNASFEIDIIRDATLLKAGQTYQMANSFGQAGGATLYYFPNSTDIFVSQPGNPQGTVTITSVTATTITGTFSGKLFTGDDFSGTTVIYTVTDGSFTAQLNSN